MRWRRAGGQLALVVLFGLLFTMGSLFGATVALDGTRLARIGHHRPIVSGNVARAAPLTTPLGVNDAAGWIGRVGRWESSGKNRHFHVYCTLAEIDGAEINGLRLEGWSRAGGRFAMRERLQNDGYASIDLAHDYVKDGQTPSEHVKRACASSYPTDAIYDEGVVQQRGALQISGCKNGDRLEPCGDGADVITYGSAQARFADAKSTAAGNELVAALFGGMGILLLAVIAARARAMLDRREERVR